MRNVIGGSVPWTVTSWKVGLISSNKLGCSTELNDQIQKSYPKNTESMGKNLCVVDLQFDWILPKKENMFLYAPKLPNPTTYWSLSCQ